MQPFSLTPILLVAAGGALGSVLRYLTTLAGVALFGTGFPWGTLTVNIIGSFGIGALAAHGIDNHARLLLVTGMLGGFTTFSAFSLETVQLWEGLPALAIAYVAASLALGLGACVLGFWVVSR